jgi:creatinine amidohydrolase/Fe(II)-dependent formamide hydrolase-like protein
MSTVRTSMHRDAIASAALAAAICMAISQIIGLLLAPVDVAETILYGLSLSFIAFGGTYAGVFFASLARSQKRPAPVAG